MTLLWSQRGLLLRSLWEVIGVSGASEIPLGKVPTNDLGMRSSSNMAELTGAAIKKQNSQLPSKEKALAECPGENSW
jgi:hypothetical protein